MKVVMKKYLFLLFILFIAFSCKKGNVIPRAGLTGKWELRITSGGISGATTNYAAGNGNTLQFNADSTFAQYQNFHLVNQGTYSIVKNGGAIIGLTNQDALYYNHLFGGVMQLNDNTLVVRDNVDDGFISTYVRQ